jgi:hypothetical protein
MHVRKKLTGWGLEEVVKQPGTETAPAGKLREKPCSNVIVVEMLRQVLSTDPSCQEYLSRFVWAPVIMGGWQAVLSSWRLTCFS